MAAQQNQNLRDVLFPDGMPEPDEFIRVIASHIREKLLNGDDSKAPNDAEVV